MFSLVITIISIALVAALALANLYYGGGAFNKGRAAAEASKVLAQGQQLLAAHDLFVAREGHIANGTAQLLARGYLKEVPVAATTMGVVFADGTAWEMPAPGVAVAFVVPQASTEVCQEVNARLGFDGVLEVARESLVSQCYGARSAHKVIFAKSSQQLAAAADADSPLMPRDEVSNAPLPAPTDNGSWVVPPSAVEGEPENPPEPPVADAPSAELRLAGAPVNSIDFAGVALGESSARTLVLHNTGNVALFVPGDGVAGLSGPFTSDGGSCLSATLAPSESCSFEVVYNPSSIAAHGPQALTVSAGTLTVGPVTVQGLGQGSVARWDSTTVAFGSRTAGSTYQLTNTVHNDGNVAGDLTLSLPAGVTASACPSVAPGASCVVTFSYTPSAGVAYNSGALVPTAATQSTNTVTVTGLGTTPGYSAAQFSSTGGCGPEDECVFNVRNNTGVALNVVRLQTTDNGFDEFARMVVGGAYVGYYVGENDYSSNGLTKNVNVTWAVGANANLVFDIPFGPANFVITLSNGQQLTIQAGDAESVVNLPLSISP